jgi:hypothetical protein
MLSPQTPSDSPEHIGEQLADSKSKSLDNAFTTAPKLGKRKPNKKSLEKVHLLTDNTIEQALPDKTPEPYSITNVHFSEFVSQRWKSDKRVPITVRINLELYKQFKRYAKAKYGSVCRPVEYWMAVELLTDSEKVHFCNTEKPISIGQIVIERNLRPRRNLEIAESVEGSPEVESERLVCSYLKCKKKAVEKAVLKGNNREYDLCPPHFAEAQSNPHLWRF